MSMIKRYYEDLLIGGSVCFAGELRISRDQAHALVHACGSAPHGHVTRQTGCVVLGDLSFGTPSKVTRAEKLEIPVIQEVDWYSALGFLIPEEMEAQHIPIP